MTSRPATRSVKNSDTIASQRARPSTQIRFSHRLSAHQRTDPPPRTQGQNLGPSSRPERDSKAWLSDKMPDRISTPLINGFPDTGDIEDADPAG